MRLLVASIWIAAGVGIVGIVGVGLVGCNRAATRTTYTDGFDQFGDRTKKMEAEASLVTRKGQTELDAAKTLLRDSKYKQGIAALERLVADRSIHKQVRQDAFMSLGEAHGAWLNPFRDYRKGITELQRLLVEYPETEHRERAQTLIDQYGKTPEQSGS